MAHKLRAFALLFSLPVITQIALIKVAAARMACKVADCAMQVYGAAGMSGDFPLAQM